jgi:hypothetical protein
MEFVCRYPTGPRFRRRIEAVEQIGHAGRTSTVNTRRRCGFRPSAARLYGDLQGIAGRSLPEIDGPDVPLPDGPAGGEAAE